MQPPNGKSHTSSVAACRGVEEQQRDTVNPESVPELLKTLS